jgi:hypothetical protein
VSRPVWRGGGCGLFFRVLAKQKGKSGPRGHIARESLGTTIALGSGVHVARHVDRAWEKRGSRQEFDVIAVFFPARQGVRC